VKDKGLSQEGHVQDLADLVLWGWLVPDGRKQERAISNAELRDILLHGGDDFRSHTLWELETWHKRAMPDDRKRRTANTLEFLDDVWPRQKSVKNPAMSTCLCRLVLSSGESFPELTDAVLPLLTKIDQNAHLHSHLQGNNSNIINNHPKHVLKLLYAVLPDEVSAWPYGIGGVLEKIGEADNGLRSDRQLRELRLKWNAR